MIVTMKLRASMWGVVLFLFAVGCRESSDNALSKSITAQIRSRPVLDLRKVANFSWDKVYIVIPYTSEEWCAKELGRECSKISHYEMNLQDRVYLFVFVNSGRVVRVAEVSAGTMSFGPHASRGFNKANAMFRVEPWQDLRSLQPMSE